MHFYRENILIIRIFQLFAIAPLPASPSNAEQKRMQFQTFASILLVVSLMVWVFVTDDFPFAIMRKLFSGTVITSQTITHLCIVIQSYVTRRKHLQIYHEFNEIDETFTVHFPRSPIDYAAAYRTKTLTAVAALVSFIVIKCIILCPVNDPYLPFYLRYVWYTELTIRALFMQIIFYVNLLAERLHWMRSEIEKIVADGQRINAHGALVRFIFTVTAGRNGDEYAKLMILKRLYGRIWSTSRLINDCRGFSALATIMQSFVFLTMYSYWMLTSRTASPILILDMATVIVLILMLCNRCNQCTQCVGVCVDSFFCHNKYNNFYSAKKCRHY